MGMTGEYHNPESLWPTWVQGVAVYPLRACESWTAAEGAQLLHFRAGGGLASAWRRRRSARHLLRACEQRTTLKTQLALCAGEKARVHTCCVCIRIHGL